MGKTSFNFSVLNRAYRETLKFFGWNARTFALAGLFCLGFVVDWWQRGWDNMLDEWHVLVNYTLAPLAGFLFLLFLWNLWLAPFKELADVIGGQARDRAKELGSSLALIDFEEPDYHHWDGIQRLTLLQAACLWGDVTPVNDVAQIQLHPNAAARYQMLVEAIADGELPACEPSLSGSPKPAKRAEPHVVISREDLTDFAVKRRDEPRFLFPDQRS